MAIGLSQKKMAFLMELPPQQISRWEKGRRRPNLYSAIGLAVATKRLVDDLFFDYREEWQERVRKRVKLLNLKVEKVLIKPKIQKHDRPIR